MKSSTSQYLYSVFRQVSQEFRQIGQKFGMRLLRTPLPKILIICIALALFITIIPLVITLFVVFVLIKLLLGVATMGAGQNRGNPPQNQYVERIDK
ncbi:hypothetical protein [Undibacterium umbellatum]|uniref:DUF3742 family protein n=1 Tax=Undibacterium umbellatum TaxID=2762300 RepID=A0ABR6ZH10_9BURK|nr:hypothetical protein [Undibacterium umbellatum]MBC3910978.1 hypothetical protein [Undibacterium umbellatum]